MTKIWIICLAQLLPLYSLAQQDYVVTVQNDTIYGKVKPKIYPFSRTVKVSTDTRCKKFRYREYNAYRHKGKKFMKTQFMSEKGKQLRWLCFVVVEGKLSLLRENTIEAPDYFLHYKGESHMIMRRYFPNQIWQELIQCPAFARKYQDYHKDEGGRMILSPRDPNIWEEMVRYYNAHCKMK